MRYFLLLFLAQLALAFSPLFQRTRALWGNNPPGPEFVGQGIAFALFFLVIAVRHRAMEDASRKESDEILSAVSGGVAKIVNYIEGATVKTLSEAEFYADFLSAAQAATYRVWIAYLAPKPPDAVNLDVRKDYHVELRELMESSESVSYRRLVRDTPANRNWVKDLANRLDGAPMVSISLFTDQIEAISHSSALSVQIIDGDNTWLVALNSHTNQDRYRDIYLGSEIVAEALANYYERLWSLSQVVMENGQLTEFGSDLMGTKAGI